MLALVKRLAPRWIIVLAVGTVAARWGTDHPGVMTLIFVAVLLVALALAVGPVQAHRRATAASDRRTRAAMLAAGSREASVAQLATMTGPEFERHVAHLLERDGCEDVRIVGGAGDRGADLTAIDPYGWRVVVQCKRYAPHRPVTDPDLQRFLGTVFEEHRADTALYVTTSRFTPAAKQLAAKRRVVLVDGDRLATWMHEGATPLPEDPLEDAV